MPLVANTRFELYNRGDVILPRDDARFRGKYPHSVVEISEEDAAGLQAAVSTGTVRQWIDDMCGRPSLAEQRALDAPAAKSAPAFVARRRNGKTKPAAPAPEPEPVDEPGEDTPTAEESDD